MKKTVLFTCLAAGLLAHSARATITFNTTPSTQNVTAGGSFNVTLSLSVTQNTAPADVDGFDLLLATAAANSGDFAITAANSTSAFAAPAGQALPPGGDPLNQAAATGFVSNSIDQGFFDATGGNAQATPLTDYSLETLTLSIATGTPAGTYTFSTTTMANAGNQYSDVADSGGNIYQTDTPGTFSITVVPEPSSNVLLAAGVGLLGFGWHRRRSRQAGLAV